MRDFTRELTGRRKSGKVPADKILTWESSDGWDLDSTAMSTDRAMKISTVNRCVEVLANSMAVLPVYVMNEDTHQRLPRHRLGPVLWDRPNEDMTPFDYSRLMLSNEVLKGNGYAWLRRDPKTANVLERIPLPPDCVTIWYDRNGTLWYFYTCPRTGQSWRIHPADMTHYKAWSKDGIEGISVLSRAAQSMITSEAAEKHQSAVYLRGGMPSGVLTTDADIGGTVPVTRRDGKVEHVSKKELIRQQWEKVHNGPDNAMRLAVLDLGLKYQPISMSNSDAQFVESSELRVADIARFFSVPLHLVYAGKQSYQSNEQNSIEFVKYTLMAYAQQHNQEDSYKMLLPSERDRGERIRRELKAFLQGDTASQAAWYKAMREIGAYSVNDIRALDDLPSVPGGDSRYASLNYVPLEAFEELARLSAADKADGGKNE